MTVDTTSKNRLNPPYIGMHNDSETNYKFLYEVWKRLGGYTDSVPKLSGLKVSADELNTLVGVQPSTTIQNTLNSYGTMAVQDSDNVAITGGSVSGIVLQTELLTLTSGSLSVVAATGVNPTRSLIRVISSTAGNVIITANPSIADGNDGQFLILEGTSNTQTVTINNGNGVQLSGGESMILGLGNTLTLIYNDSRSVWVETSRSDSLFWRR